MPMTSQSRSIDAPAAWAAFAKPMVTPLGSAIPSRAQNVAAMTPAAFTPGARRGTSSAPSHETSTPRLRWSATFFRNVSTDDGEDSRKR